jgi:hypothetical protein
MVVKVWKKGTTFSIVTSSDSECKLNQKIVKSRFVFDFRKLNKIARNGLKIQKFAWR